MEKQVELFDQKKAAVSTLVETIRKIEIKDEITSLVINFIIFSVNQHKVILIEQLGQFL